MSTRRTNYGNPRQSSISSKKRIDEAENKKAKENPCKDEAAVN
jgi:hypothetical protein